MTKRPSLFGTKAAPAEGNERTPSERAKAAADDMAMASGASAIREAIAPGKYPKASTREGKRVVTAYLDPEAFRQLKRIAADEDAQQQDLLLEGINAVFEKRGLSRIA
jgi:hypothetical protein